MKHYILLFGVCISLLFGACSVDYELNRPVFNPDEIHPELPAYSEWGYNSFGMFIDRRAFVSSYWDLPVKIMVQDDILQLQLRGYTRYYDWNILTFFIKGLSFSTYEDLLSLHEQSFDLTSDNCRITLTGADRTIIHELGVLSGELNFKRAQHLYVDKQSQQVILSGTFNFKAMMEAEPITASEGRFDLGVGEDNFYFMAIDHQ